MSWAWALFSVSLAGWSGGVFYLGMRWQRAHSAEVRLEELVKKVAIAATNAAKVIETDAAEAAKQNPTKAEYDAFVERTKQLIRSQRDPK